MLVTRHRFWIEILALSSAVACALALLLAMLGTAATAANHDPPAPSPASPVAKPTSSAQLSTTQSSPAQEQMYEGVVTDTHCGARHEAAIGKTARECTRACIHGGAQFALVNGDKIYVLSGDLETLKRSAGQRSKVIGALNGDTITVSSIAAGI